MSPATYKTFVDSYQTDYSKLKEESRNWQKTADVLFTLTLIVTLLGATVTILQPLPEASWKKWVLAFIGITIASATHFKDNLPDGSYKTYQQAINKAKVEEREIEKGFKLVNTSGVNPDDLKVYIGFICTKLRVLQDLSSNYSSTFPPILDYFIRPAKAGSDVPNWVTAPPEGVGMIVAKGEGPSISAAKADAEQNGARMISSALQDSIDKSLTKEIYKPLKSSIAKSLATTVTTKDVYFDTDANSSSYWVLYKIDDKKIKRLLDGINFPLTIFSTDVIADKVETLKSKLTELGFAVTVSPAPRGPASETNAIFAGEGVPVIAIQEAALILIEQNIGLRAIVYPWAFKKSSLPETQKLNHLQIGGSREFETWPELQQSDLDRLKAVSTPLELEAFCKNATDKLKEAWGL